MHVVSSAAPAWGLLPLAALLLSLAACGDPGTPQQPAAPPGVPPTAAGQVTVTHVLIAFRNERMADVKRSKTQAFEVAKSLLAEAVAGGSFDAMVTKFSDDKNKEGKPNTNNGRPGSYTFPPPQMMPTFDAAARATPVGKLAPEPVETPYGYHLIRRDA